jgi:hypothetical protein
MVKGKFNVMFRLFLALWLKAFNGDFSYSGNDLFRGSMVF